jgi:hypothetical protein
MAGGNVSQRTPPVEGGEMTRLTDLRAAMARRVGELECPDFTTTSRVEGPPTVGLSGLAIAAVRDCLAAWPGARARRARSPICRRR